MNKTESAVMLVIY